MSIGVPIKLLHEAENHVVTVELKTGELFRGYLMEAEVKNLFILTNKKILIFLFLNKFFF